MRYPVAVAYLVTLAFVMASSLAGLSIAMTPQDVWTPIGPAGEYVRALVVDPRQPTTLYIVGARDRGIYKSTDGGGSWQAMNAGLNSTWVQALAIDPRTPTTLYAGVGPISMDTGGLFKSTDGGRSWRAINEGLATGRRTTLSIDAIVIDPQTPTTLYVGAWGGVFKSTDGGDTWHAMNTGLDATALNPHLLPTDLNFHELFVHSLAIDPRTPTTLYAVTTFGLGTEVHGVLKSTDGASSWRPLATGPAGSNVVGLAIDPQTTTTLYARTAESGVLKSTDAGGSWQAMSNGLADLRVNALAIDPQTPTTIYAGTWHGVFRSTDGGGGWEAINAGLTDLSVVALNLSPQNPAAIYAGTHGSGVFLSPSRSETRALPTPQTAGSPADSVSVIALSVGRDGSVWLGVEIRGDLPVYAGSRRTALYRMSSSGNPWQQMLDASGRGRIERLWLFGSGSVIALIGDAIMRTTDGGARWQSSPELPVPVGGPDSNDGISFINPDEGWMLISGYPGMNKAFPTLYHTQDGADHWTRLLQWPETHGLGVEYKSGIEFVDAHNGWIGTDAKITPGGYLYVSRDGGASWQRQDLVKTDDSVRVLPPKFFGAQTGVAVAQFGRTATVFSTSDGGRSWGNPRQLPFGPWDFLTPTVWAAAMNQTLWLSSDAGQTWSQHSVPLPPMYGISRVALAGPAGVWLVGTEVSQMPPGVRRPVADYVLQSSDAGLHWTRVALPLPR